MSRPFLLAHPVLRLLALLVLCVGVLAKPVLVVACEVEDLGALSGIAAGASAAPEKAVAGDDCCPGRACGECCTAVASVVPMATPPMPAAPLPDQPQARLAQGAEPAPRADSLRPPITG